MIIKNKDGETTDLGKGVKRKILAYDGKLMTVEFSFNKGSIGAMHNHPHEQVGYIAKGSFEVTCGDDKEIISKGDSYYVPSNVMHGVVALEDGIIVDVFTPIREDFLK